MMDPRDDRSDPRLTGPRDALSRRRLRNCDQAALEAWPGHSMWAWAASIAAAVFIIAIAYGFANQRTQTQFDRHAPGPVANSLTGAAGAGSDGTKEFGGVETTGAGSTSGRSTQFPPF